MAIWLNCAIASEWLCDRVLDRPQATVRIAILIPLWRFRERTDENKRHIMEIGGALRAMAAVERFPDDAKLHEFTNMLLKNLANNSSMPLHYQPHYRPIVC
jgi:hypothetical protein